MGTRYETLFQLASGGMATVFVGTARGALGFLQVVAIKRPHAHLLADPDYARDLLAEARLAALIHHANVVDVRDVEADGTIVSLILEYVEGVSLAELLQNALDGGPPVPPALAVRVALDALAGLHAAHELKDERGRAVNLVHRDVSPQNLLVGVDGVTRVTDFGVAKFESRGASTTDGHLKGKIAYMAPEYLRGEPIDRRFDIFSVGVVLWETLAGRRLFRGEHEADTLRRVLAHSPPLISEVAPHVGTALDAVVETSLAKAREHRFENARAMASALETSARAGGLLAEHREVADLVRASCGPKIEERRARIRERLADEPSIASAFADAPSTPAATTESPPVSPTIRDLPAPAEVTLRAVAMPAPAAPATTLRSAEPAKVPESEAAPEVPISRSRAPAILGVGAGAAIAVAGLALAFAKIGASKEELPASSSASVASGAPAPPEPAPAAAPPPSVASTPAPARAAPSHAAPSRRAAPPKPPPRGPSAPASSAPASSDPPPNPYAQ